MVDAIIADIAKADDPRVVTCNKLNFLILDITVMSLDESSLPDKKSGIYSDLGCCLSMMRTGEFASLIKLSSYWAKKRLVTRVDIIGGSVCT